MKKRLLLFGFTFCSFYCFSQENILKCNPFELTKLSITVSYERLIRQHQSVVFYWKYSLPAQMVSFGRFSIMSGQLPHHIIQNNDVLYNNSFPSFSFLPEWRLYFKNKREISMNGAYWANYLRYDFTTLDNAFPFLAISSGVSSGVSSKNATYQQQHFSIGSGLGYQWINGCFVLDAFLGGNIGMGYFKSSFFDANARQDASAFQAILKPAIVKTANIKHLDFSSSVSSTFFVREIRTGLRAGFCF
ncbi:MAG: hypothetical protein ACKVTZ_15660 [Bacteroidia bacterium]